MTEQDALQELDDIAVALHRVLSSEYEALKRLDTAAVEHATGCKDVLNSQLAKLCGKLPDRPGIRRTIGGIQAASQVNQALLVHARACVRGALELASGMSIEPASYARANGTSPALRVDIRG